ncbi:MAG TPA: DinB family protein [Pyrinomonadaceae bacterium]|nr:DinB family protein [Pyrinomonadaceae bacterium]
MRENLFMDYLTADLPTVITEANNIAAETKSTFGRLTPTQLNWKPSPERWSVAQCFEHLLTSNKGFFPRIDGVLAGIKPTFWQRMPVVPGLAGRLLIKSLDPKSTRKIRAPKKFQPAQSDISPSVLDDFVDQQSKIVEKMKATEHLDLEKIIITSPVAAAITYSMMDAYRVIVVHERRHFEQARRVTEEAAFPV